MSRPKLFNERQSVHIYMDQSMMDRLNHVALNNELSRGEIIRTAFNYLLDRLKVFEENSIPKEILFETFSDERKKKLYAPNG